MSTAKKVLMVFVFCYAAMVVMVAPASSQVAVCNWENFEQYGHDGFNWRWWGCNLSLHGQYQCRGEPNTNQCYTVTEARREVRAFRAWTGRG